MGLLLWTKRDSLVDDLKVVPLGMAFGVGIVFEPKIVLDIVQLGCLPQIATLKPGVEDKHVLVVRYEDLRPEALVGALTVELGQIAV